MTSCKRLTFILGILPRSGTNYVRDILLQHPDASGTLFAEDYLVHYSEHLDKYVTEVSNHWVQKNRGDAPLLWSAIGEALAGMLIARASKPGRARIVTKTPSTVGIETMSKLFPGSSTILLVRDGRDVVESMRLSFGSSFDEIAFMWAANARRLHAFIRKPPEGWGGILFRYEDLVEHPRDLIPKLLTISGFDAKRYDLEAALKTPVRGSSTFGRVGNADITWDVTHPKTAEFKPIGRWKKSWTKDEILKFERIAGDAMRLFGYDL